jgi:tRNA threonylcarbamoyladenosine biosynthesis protein TsaE
MRSKKSKPSLSKHELWKAEPGCSEQRLTEFAGELARLLSAGDRVLLEGEMGAGKSTFARAVLLTLGVHQPPEGSPSFAIAHEYVSPRFEVVHMDLYRIRSETEIEEAGIPAYFWERDAVVLVEWAANWPEFERSIEKASPGRHCWRVKIQFSKVDQERDLEIFKLLS